MEEFTSRTARCSSVASRNSTIAASAAVVGREARVRTASGRPARTRGRSRRRFSRRCVSTSSRSTADVRSGVSPERTSTSSTAPSSVVAGAADGVACAARLLLDRDREAVEGGSRRGRRRRRRAGRRRARAPTSSTQSTMRRPRIGWRCFGTSERMRVPSPAAMTTAPRVLSPFDDTEAGAPGFEPGITGPKPVALPLGHAPLRGAHLATHGRSTASSGRVTSVRPDGSAPRRRAQRPPPARRGRRRPGRRRTRRHRNDAGSVELHARSATRRDRSPEAWRGRETSEIDSSARWNAVARSLEAVRAAARRRTPRRRPPSTASSRRAARRGRRGSRPGGATRRELGSVAGRDLRSLAEKERDVRTDGGGDRVQGVRVERLGQLGVREPSAAAASLLPPPRPGRRPGSASRSERASAARLVPRTASDSRALRDDRVLREPLDPELVRWLEREVVVDVHALEHA